MQNRGLQRPPGTWSDFLSLQRGGQSCNGTFPCGPGALQKAPEQTGEGTLGVSFGGPQYLAAP